MGLSRTLYAAAVMVPFAVELYCAMAGARIGDGLGDGISAQR